MKRALRIAGYSLCIIAGMYVSVTTKIWPFVWTVGFALMYAGVLGMYRVIKEYFRQPEADATAGHFS